MSTYRRNRKSYTLTVTEIEGRFHAVITDNTNGSTWTSGGYSYRESALRAAQNKYNEITK